jgi:uncharacterized FlaG/YvyC family protein
MSISSVGASIAAAAVQPTPAPRPLAQDQSTIIQAVKAVNQAELFGQENELTFIVDRTSNRPALRIVNRSTHEVVAQIPSEAVLELAAGITGSKAGTDG